MQRTRCGALGFPFASCWRCQTSIRAACGEDFDVLADVSLSLSRKKSSRYATSSESNLSTCCVSCAAAAGGVIRSIWRRGVAAFRFEPLTGMEGGWFALIRNCSQCVYRYWCPMRGSLCCRSISTVTSRHGVCGLFGGA